MNITPPNIRTHYNQKLRGVYGEFGSGAGSRAFYLQSAMSPAELDNISLVSDIPGSDKWPVRALFQRDIDTIRVLQGLIPYLRDTTQVRFFNPITLTLLPMDEQGHSVVSEMPDLKKDKDTIDGRRWTILERPDFYRLRWMTGAPEYAVVEWNTGRCKMIAIDGQHRLFGLKTIWSGSADVPAEEDFRAWRIPVVVVSFRVLDEGTTAPSVLDTVRRIFVSINTNAQRVNAARRILLSDDSVNCLCTQELVEAAHSNDRLPSADRDNRLVPLLLFDWRGEEKNEKRVASPAALHDIVEVHDWFKSYFLGEDFKTSQQRVMGIVPVSPLYEAFMPPHRLSYSHADLVREWAREDLLPALIHLLSNFGPYSGYIAALRGIEHGPRDPKRASLVGYALDELRFGTSRAFGALRDQVLDMGKELMGEIDNAKKEHLDRVFLDDIGFRGVAWAFGSLRDRFAGPPEWMEYASLFTDALNRAHADGWLGLNRGVPHRDRLLHVVEDPAGRIVNYRLESAKGALGCHVALLVAAYGAPWPSEWKFSWSQFLEEKLDVWRSTVERGYRKQFRAALKEEYPQGGQPLTRAVRHKAGPAARGRASRMRKALEAIVATRQGK